MYNPQLDTFISVADAGSFSKAAEELYVTPTAVIKQINVLEEKLRFRLFNRSNRGLTLTAAGKSLYNDAKYLISYSEKAVARARNAGEEEKNVIRIGISPLTPAQILLQIWPQIHSHVPDLRFQLVPFDSNPDDPSEVLSELGRDFDVIAGIFDNTMLDCQKCKGFVLSQQPLCCAVSLNHKLADKAALKIPDLYGEQLMLPHPGWSDSLDQLRKDIAENYPLIKVFDFDYYNVDVFNECETSNRVLTVIHGWEYVHPLLRVIPVNWKYTIPFGLLYAAEPSDKVQDFLQSLEEALEEQPLKGV